MSDTMAYLSKMRSMLGGGSPQEKQVADLLFSRKEDLPLLVMGDRLLNNVAAMTWNADSCEKIFRIIDKALTPQDYPYRTLHSAVLLVHTILLYGSEVAVDRAIQISRFVFSLQTYNSAMVMKNSAFGLSTTSGGMDRGEPVRIAAKALFDVMISDDNIRSARAAAKNENPGTLVPMGQDLRGTMTAPVAPSSSHSGLNAGLQFGMATEKALGAGFSLEQVPGMYDGRPERYFDSSNDPRARKNETGDHQFTREGVMQAQGSSLLDLAFDAPVSEGMANASVFLADQNAAAALQSQLAAAQEQIRAMQTMGGGGGVPCGMPLPMPGLQLQQKAGGSGGNSLLDLVAGPSYTVPSSSGMGTGGMGTGAGFPQQQQGFMQQAPMAGMAAGYPQHHHQQMGGPMGFAGMPAQQSVPQQPPQTSLMGINLSYSATGPAPMPAQPQPQPPSGMMSVPDMTTGGMSAGMPHMGTMQMRQQMDGGQRGGMGMSQGPGPQGMGMGFTVTAPPPTVEQPNTISDMDQVPCYAPPPPPPM